MFTWTVSVYHTIAYSIFPGGHVITRRRSSLVLLDCFVTVRGLCHLVPISLCQRTWIRVMAIYLISWREQFKKERLPDYKENVFSSPDSLLNN